MRHEIYKNLDCLPDEMIDKILKINLFEELLECTSDFDCSGTVSLTVSEYYKDNFEEIASGPDQFGNVKYLTDFYQFEDDFYGPCEGRFY